MSRPFSSITTSGTESSVSRFWRERISMRVPTNHARMEEWTSDMLFSFKPSGGKGQKDSVGQEEDCAVRWD